MLESFDELVIYPFFHESLYYSLSPMFVAPGAALRHTFELTERYMYAACTDGLEVPEMQ